jgi:hypothetical protein
MICRSNGGNQMEEIILRVMKTTKVRSNIFFISKVDPNLDPTLKLMTKSNPNLIWDTVLKKISTSQNCHKMPYKLYIEQYGTVFFW